MNPPLDASSSAGRPTRVRYLVLGWLCAATAIAYIQRNCIGVLESTFRGELDLTKEQMGLVMSGFFWTYAIFQIPSGRLGDAWGARAALPLYSGLWSAAMVLMALAGTVVSVWVGQATGFMATGFAGAAAFGAWLLLLSSRLLAGAGQAGIFPCAAVVLFHWFPHSQRGITSGWLSCFMQVGAVAAASLTGWAIGWLDWRWVLVAFALPGFAWSLAFFVWFRDRPRDHPAVTLEELALIGDLSAADGRRDSEPPAPREPMPWLTLAGSPAIWCICFQQFFRASGYIFFVTWFPTYLQQAQGASVEVSGYLSSAVLLAILVGSPLGGTLSDQLLTLTGSRRRARADMAVVCLLAAAGLIFLAWRTTALGPQIALLVASMFCAALTGPVSYAATIDMGGRHVATVFSVMNMSGNIGAALLPIIVPHLLGEAENWDRIFLMLVAIYLLAALGWFFLNPTGTVFDRSLWKRR